jgi:carboxylesterase type B
VNDDNIPTAGIDDGQLECLRSLPVDTILDLTRGLTGAAFHPAFGVGSVPIDPIAKLMAEGTSVRRIILGWNKHDGTQFAPGSWAADSETNATHCCPVPIAPVSEAVWTEQLRSALGRQLDLSAPRQKSAEVEAQARALYTDQEGQHDSVAPLNGVDRWWQLVDLITDTWFSCPTLRIAERLSSHYAAIPPPDQGDGVRVFQFNHRSR